ncbi:hypothetical protein IP84_10000 [beta proteobacterium AAP99]|nr:hypothetical protein IP84_10000 [beta proteobacterium AAP99]
MLALSVLSPVSAQVGGEPLHLSFPEKPPLYFGNGSGVARGTLIEPLRQRGPAAGLRLSFEQRPPKRILAEIEANQSAMCSLGWFKNAERERFAKFSRPLYRDRGMLVVSALPVSTYAGVSSLSQLLARGAWRLGAVSGISYGAEIDAILSAHPTMLERPTVTSEQLLRMVVSGRMPLALVTEEELNWFLKHEAGDTRLARLPLSDLPRQGSQRYIMCSLKTPDALLKRIDAMIGDGLVPGQN